MLSYSPVKLDRGKALLADLEQDPEQVPAFYRELESAIRWLMDLAFESKDPHEKTRLAATELWARLVLERLRKQNVI